ncbi:MAG: DM13 domain-containing protein [Cyanobacteria bacterium J06559_3]
MKRFTIAILSAAALGLSLVSGANAFRSLDFSPLISNPATESNVLLAEATGGFVTVEQDHPTTGTARMVTENGQNYLVFDDAFDTARGPDVQVVLYTGAEAPVNLAEGDYVTVGDLQSFEGTQRYLLPADIDVNDYASVAIWCREFNVTFGYAPL